MKVEIAQITTDPGRFEGNKAKIIDSIKRAKQDGADLVVFPELTIPGYMSMDLMLNTDYLKMNRDVLSEIIKETKGISAIVGFIGFDRKTLGPDGTHFKYNSAAVISNGKLLGTEGKTLLPDYDVFYERRYFQSGGEKRVYEISGIRVGVEICEDSWDEDYPIKVSDALVEKGAQILVNISASPFYVGKGLLRERLIKKIIAKHHIPFIYTNLVGGQDGYEGELVFDGSSMVFDKSGRLIGLGKKFEEDAFMVDLANPKPVKTLKYHPVIELHDSLVFGIREYFRRTGFTKAFIGLSGGIDSAVTAALSKEALGRENLTGVFMPTKFSSFRSFKDARGVAQNLGIDFKNIPLDSTLGFLEIALSKEFKSLPSDVTEENIQARLRGVVLMAFANKFNGLVISTGNKTETALGYTTLYGDMCGGLAAISDVSKLKVYDLADYINSAAGQEVIPQSIIQKPPSAELKNNQKDEDSLGPYKLVSPMVDKIIEDGRPKKYLYKKYPKDLVDKVFRLIAQAEHKRRQAPPGIKVTKKAFGIGRRVPIAHGFRG